MSQHPEGSICDVRGILVGHFTDPRRPTGCTVILAEAGAVGGVDVRGGAPGTRETDLLDPCNTVEKVHAILLSGGSAFGLSAAEGVVAYLEEKGIGFDTGDLRVPIVPAAVLYDLQMGDSKIRPDRTAGYQACLHASTKVPSTGSVGAGAGATVGKVSGMARAMKGGLGTASLRSGNDVVGAMIVVNAFGDIVNPENGNRLAGVRTESGDAVASTLETLMKGRGESHWKGKNTTIGVIATNLNLTKAQVAAVARMAHAGLARTIVPVHTPVDGDTLFALSTGHRRSKVDLVKLGAMAAEVTAQAVLEGILAAKGLPNLPSAMDLILSPEKRDR